MNENIWTMPDSHAYHPPEPKFCVGEGEHKRCFTGNDILALIATVERLDQAVKVLGHIVIQTGLKQGNINGPNVYGAVYEAPDGTVTSIHELRDLFGLG